MFSDPLIKVFSKHKLDKLPAFFCHASVHNGLCISIEHFVNYAFVKENARNIE